MPLDPTDLARLSRLLDEALDLSPAEFESWIAALPVEHRHLLPRLRDMLGSRMAGGDTGFLSDGPKLDGHAVDDTIAKAGDLVGSYRLLREIGQGGMGSVWLAERADGALKRKVALKLPRLAWGAGLAARMARERDIGALLEHPNIARLYDAGVDQRGRPYLALEFIDGLPIDRWLAERGLSVRQRIALFVHVVRAVAYAHGRLVIHRDIKPSNVLVTVGDVPHLLDFGIAKLINDVSGGDALTREQDRLLTPRYSSPEQIGGEAITVASDVYSLGVLLYELLAGTHPYRVAHDSAAALERAILEGDVLLASGNTRNGNAKALRGDVDAILAKALRRETDLRYATADALADDLERYLDGERVLAQPDSLRYCARKLVAKHRSLFVAVTFSVIAVLGGAVAAVVLARQASEAASIASTEARRADASAARARAVNEFVIDIFRINERGKGDDEARQLPVEALLERGASLIEDNFAIDSSLQAELYGVVARIFANIGVTNKAAFYAGRQVDVLEVNGADRQDRVKALILLASTLLADSRPDEAEAKAKLAMERSDPRSAQWTEAGQWLVRILQRTDSQEASQVRAILGDPAEVRKASWQLVRQYLLHRTTFHDAEAIARSNWSLMADHVAGLNLGALYLLWGDLARADSLISDSAEAIRLAGERDEPRLHAIEMEQLVAMYAGRHQVAERLSRETLVPDRYGDKRRLLIIGLPDVKPLNLMMQRRFDDAEAALAAGPPERYGKERDWLLARVKLERGDAASALSLLPAEVTDADDQWLLYDHGILRGEILCAVGQREKGLALLGAAIRRQRSLVFENHPELARASGVAGLCAWTNGEWGKAIELARLSHAAFVVQPGVSPYFKKPSQQLDALLASSRPAP